jgi:xylulokinase
MGDVWVGLDIGTQGVRAAAYSSAGRLVAQGVAWRPPRSAAPGLMTHDPVSDWWGGTCEALRPIVDAVPARSIAGIGLAGLFPAVCLIDRGGATVLEGILHGDVRGRELAGRISAEIGVVLNGDEVISRLVWLQEAGRGVLRRAHLALGPSGYVAFRLTGIPSIDPHSAVRWGGLVNPKRGEWDATVARRLGIPVGLLPPIRRSHDILGAVTEKAAGETGLPAGVPVVTGLTDTLAELLGSGVVTVGELLIYYGSSGTLLYCTSDLEDEILQESRFSPTSPYRLAAYVLNSGSLLEQVRREFLGGLPYELLDEEAAGITPGADGLYVIPYISGKVPTQAGSGVRGAILGLGLGHGRAHLWRALLESFGYPLIEARDNLRRTVATATASGGGAQSRTWRQIISDMTGWSQVLAPPGGAARGAAYLAAYALRAAEDLRSIRRHWLSEWFDGPAADPTTPDWEAVERYRWLFGGWMACERAVVRLGNRGRHRPRASQEGRPAAAEALAAGPRAGRTS